MQSEFSSATHSSQASTKRAIKGLQLETKGYLQGHEIYYFPLLLHLGMIDWHNLKTQQR